MRRFVNTRFGVGGGGTTTATVSFYTLTPALICTAGGAAATTAVRLTTTGGSPTSFSIGTLSLSSGTGWLQARHIILAGDRYVELTVTPTSLSPGTVTATIPVIVGNGSPGTTNLTLTVTVNAAGVANWIAPSYTLPTIATWTSTGYTYSFDTRTRPSGLSTIATCVEQGSPSANRTELQSKIDAATSSGGRIIVPAGFVVEGPITFRNRGSGDAAGWLQIAVADADTNLPQGTRVGTSGANMFTIRTQNIAASGRAITTDAGANRVWVVGCKIEMNPSQTASSGLAYIGVPNGSVSADVPTHIVFDRCLGTGASTANIRRIFIADAKFFSTIDCRLTECHEAGSDAQALAAWNSPGPQFHYNTLFEAAGENVMFGGASVNLPTTEGIPKDIVFEQCHFNTPVAWKNVGWQPKNLFESKYCRRVLFHACILEGMWQESQDGNGINLTGQQVAVADGGNTQDVIFDMCIVRNVPFPFSFYGKQAGANAAQRFEVINTLMYNLNRGAFTTSNYDPYFCKNGEDLDGLHVEHTTAYWGNSVACNGIASLGGGRACRGVIWRNNIGWSGSYGVKGSAAEGKASMDGGWQNASNVPDYIFDRNAYVGGFNPSNYNGLNGAPTNWMGITEASVGFTDPVLAPSGLALNGASDYRAGGPRQATTGYALGAPVAEIVARTTGVA